MILIVSSNPREIFKPDVGIAVVEITVVSCAINISGVSISSLSAPWRTALPEITDLASFAGIGKSFTRKYTDGFQLVELIATEIVLSKGVVFATCENTTIVALDSGAV